MRTSSFLTVLVAVGGLLAQSTAAEAQRAVPRSGIERGIKDQGVKPCGKCDLVARTRSAKKNRPVDGKRR